jgi:hypothetical protein
VGLPSRIIVQYVWRGGIWSFLLESVLSAFVRGRCLSVARVVRA